MSNVKKSYTLTKEQQAMVDAQLKFSKEKYKSIAHIIWKSQIDVSPYFDHELEE